MKDQNPSQHTSERSRKRCFDFVIRNFFGFDDDQMSNVRSHRGMFFMGAMLTLCTGSIYYAYTDRANTQDVRDILRSPPFRLIENAPRPDHGIEAY